MTNIKVAVTGGIGSGKSYVCSILREKGIEVFDCDDAAKRIIRTNASVRERLARTVGPDTFNGNELNKSAVASFILSSEENAKKVNDIVHPAVAEEFRNSGTSFMECAILFTSGFDKLVDKVICVTAPFDVRVERIMQRDGISRQRATEWINRQMDQQRMAELSDCVICNDGKSDICSAVYKVLNDLNL